MLSQCSCQGCSSIALPSDTMLYRPSQCLHLPSWICPAVFLPMQPTWLFGSAAGPTSQLGVVAGVLQVSCSMPRVPQLPAVVKAVDSAEGQQRDPAAATAPQSMPSLLLAVHDVLPRLPAGCVLGRLQAGHPGAEQAQGRELGCKGQHAQRAAQARLQPRPAKPCLAGACPLLVHQSLTHLPFSSWRPNLHRSRWSPYCSPWASSQQPAPCWEPWCCPDCRWRRRPRQSAGRTWRPPLCWPLWCR